jgi:hypothetical protein
MPMRVLDSDGVGNVVVIAQAIRDAVLRGSGVINLSFGTETASAPRCCAGPCGGQGAGVLVAAQAALIQSRVPQLSRSG